MREESGGKRREREDRSRKGGMTEARKTNVNAKNPRFHPSILLLLRRLLLLLPSRCARLLLLFPQFEFLDLPLELLDPVLPELRHLLHVQGRDLVERLEPLRPLPRDRLRCQREPHVLRAIDQLEDRAGGLVILLGLDAEHARVAAGAVGVALAEGTKEFWKDFVGGL